MDPEQLLELVIRPTLLDMKAHSRAAELLILGTIWQESRGRFIKQIGGGPALGLIQMEPKTHDDIWCNFLKYRPELAGRVSQFLSVDTHWKMPLAPPSRELISNLRYGIAMCRVHYMRVREPLPALGQLNGMAVYWKKYYNTNDGLGNASEFVRNFPLP